MFSYISDNVHEVKASARMPCIVAFHVFKTIKYKDPKFIHFKKEQENIIFVGRCITRIKFIKTK